MWDSGFTYVGNLSLSFLSKEIDLVETGYPDQCFNSTEARVFDVFQFLEICHPQFRGEKRAKPVKSFLYGRDPRIEVHEDQYRFI